MKLPGEVIILFSISVIFTKLKDYFRYRALYSGNYITLIMISSMFSGHDESYNPPPEYLPTEEEVRTALLHVVAMDTE